MIELRGIHFIDIETVPVVNDYPMAQELGMIFNKKFGKELDELPLTPAIGLTYDTQNKFWGSKAGLYAEFGKIVCVSIGKMQATKFYIKTICSRDEKTLLTQLSEQLSKVNVLCAHNGKEFDYPMLYRRYLINDLPVPQTLVVAGKKSWDIPHLDTMEMWSHMQWKYRCSLELLAHVLGLPSPKKEMDGSQVAEVYYSMFDGIKNDELPFDKEKETLDKIGKYCSGDILTLANVFCKMTGQPIIKDDQVEYV